MKRRQELEENKLQLDFTLDAAQIISWEYNPDTRIFYSPRSTVFEGMTISLDEYLSFVDLEDRDLLRKGLGRPCLWKDPCDGGPDQDNGPSTGRSLVRDACRSLWTE